MKVLLVPLFVFFLCIAIAFNTYAWWQSYQIYKAIEPRPGNFWSFAYKFRLQNSRCFETNFLQFQTSEVRSRVAAVRLRMRYLLWAGALNFALLMLVFFLGR
jgi:hypothetical protein